MPSPKNGIRTRRYFNVEAADDATVAKSKVHCVEHEADHHTECNLMPRSVCIIIVRISQNVYISYINQVSCVLYNIEKRISH